MRLDFVMQHELQRRAGDIVLVDHEHPSLVYGFGCLDTDLHRQSPHFAQQALFEGVAISVPRAVRRKCRETLASAADSAADACPVSDRASNSVRFKTPVQISRAAIFPKADQALKARERGWHGRC
jgi:hypothetical protein